MLDKLNRKDRRRAERGGADADLEWLLVNGFEALLEAELDAEQGDSGSIRFHNGGWCWLLNSPVSIFHSIFIPKSWCRRRPGVAARQRL